MGLSENNISLLFIYDKKTVESLQKAFETGDRALLGKTMPAKGLSLVEVDYGDALKF